MGSDVKSLRGEMTWLKKIWLKKTWLKKTWLKKTWLKKTWLKKTWLKKTWLIGHVRLVLLPIIAVAGLAAWTMLPGRSGAESQREPAPSPAVLSTSEPSRLNPAATPTQATLATPADAAVPEEMGPQPAPIDGLKISSQSWRRGGLGSKALVTFTLRNGNYYAVRDIEISCAFARRDGSHLTDRTRLIHDTVNMKSRKTFARMHVGFVNINASKAKCSLVTAQALQAADTSQEASTRR